jgi:hypothetical protein
VERTSQNEDEHSLSTRNACRYVREARARAYPFDPVSAGSGSILFALALTPFRKTISQIT